MVDQLDTVAALQKEHAVVKTVVPAVERVVAQRQAIHVVDEAVALPARRGGHHFAVGLKERGQVPFGPVHSHNHIAASDLVGGAGQHLDFTYSLDSAEFKLVEKRHCQERDTTANKSCAAYQ